MWSAILDSAISPVVIVLLDPTSNADTYFFQAAMLRRPDFLFLQTAMEPLDVAIVFRLMIRRFPFARLISLCRLPLRRSRGASSSNRKPKGSPEASRGTFSQSECVGFSRTARSHSRPTARVTHGN